MTNTIHTILEAEQEAASILEKARDERNDKIEAARFEKQQKLDSYRQELADKHDQEISKLDKEKEGIDRRVSDELKKKQATIEETARANHEKAVKSVLSKITGLDT